MPQSCTVCPAAVTVTHSPASTTAPRSSSRAFTSSTRPVQNS